MNFLWRACFPGKDLTQLNNEPDNYLNNERTRETPGNKTAEAFDEDKANAYAAGMNWHIAKPIKIDKLMSALTMILEK